MKEATRYRLDITATVYLHGEYAGIAKSDMTIGDMSLDDIKVFKDEHVYGVGQLVTNVISKLEELEEKEVQGDSHDETSS